MCNPICDIRRLRALSLGKVLGDPQGEWEWPCTGRCQPLPKYPSKHLGLPVDLHQPEGERHAVPISAKTDRIRDSRALDSVYRVGWSNGSMDRGSMGLHQGPAHVHCCCIVPLGLLHRHSQPYHNLTGTHRLPRNDLPSWFISLVHSSSSASPAPYKMF